MRGRRHKLQVSTFPFLAVLLCAMGSLILVLLVMDRKAHQAAQARAQRQSAQMAEESARSESARQAEVEQRKQQARKEWEQKRDTLHEKLTREQIELQLQMRKVREELQGIAARLHYEQDTTTQLRRKTQDERSRLQAEEQLLQTLRSNAKQTENQSKESSQALRRMTLDLLQMEQVLKDLKASKQREQKTFSVVPYYGRRGENRRPLYVECTADGVIFHPERKAMPVTALVSVSDDSASGVRAEVERRIAQQRQKLAGLPNNVDKTPYLLLLLRPSGVTTYHLLQRALRGLPLDFGYEFIDEDWVLDFPADDELPSTQPWMIATKTPSRPAVAPPVVAAPPQRTSPRPMGGAPTGNAVGAFNSGIRGFRASEATGNGSWAKGDVSPSGSPTGVAGGGVGGTGSASSTGSGVGGVGSGTAGGSGIAGSQALFGNGGSGSEPRADARALAGPRADARGSVIPSRGNGHGHPSAMPPTFLSDESGSGSSRQSSVSGSGFRGGLFPIRGSNSGSGTGAAYAGDGSAGGPGSDLLGLGPPRALTSGPGGGYAGGGTGPSGLAGTGSIGRGIPGSGVPGSGWAGGGSTGSDIPGSAVGMGTSGDGGYVIARGNNIGDAADSTFNGGGGAANTGGPGLPGGSGGSSSGNAINYGPNFGMQGSGGSSSGAQVGGGGTPGGPAGAGMPMPSPLGGGGIPSGASINNGPNSGKNGSAGSAPGSGQATNSGGAAGNGATAMPGTSQVGGASSTAQINNGTNPGSQGTGSSSQGAGGSASGGVTVIGGTPNAQGGAGGPMPPNGGRSGDVVIFVDPLTGKPTTAPRPAPSPGDASGEGSPPEQNDGNPGARRVRVIPVTGAATGGGSGPGDAQAEAMNRFAPTPTYAPPPRRLTAPRPAWVHGGRDWTIYVECRAAALVLYPSQRAFTIAEAISPPAGNPLLKAIQQMIDRRQSSRRRDEPPYHPQICLLVRPEHIRTFLTVYPALEALPVPKTRRNLDADDDVISIVTGAVP